MGIAANLLGRTVRGNKLGGVWHVTEQLVVPLDALGYSRTYGYKVKHESGREAFLKAVDADLIDAGETLVVRLTAVLAHHDFEARVSEHCRGNNMDRVTLAIDHGSEMMEHDGAREPVFYLIFELASGDVRQQILLDRDWPADKKFRLLHHIAVGLQQLHGAKVTHNDVKPPNVLAFNDGHRISDLGQATRDDAVAPHDGNAIVGDPRYAAPELLYIEDGAPGTRHISNENRRGTDLYLLGSMVHFLFVGRMLTPEILDELDANHSPPIEDRGWQGGYSDVTPYWRAGFSTVLHRFKLALSKSDESVISGNAEVLTQVIAELCEPEPSKRGHVTSATNGPSHSLIFFISLFDRLAKVPAN